jgi:phosphatidylserine decarboxylase
MSTRVSVTYCDRGRRKLLSEEIYAHGFLSWSYNTRLGKLATDLLLRQKIVSRLYGWYHRQPWSRRRIESFCQRMSVNTGELLCPLSAYASFNDFFTRKIDLSQRTLCGDPDVCIAPADGKVLAYPSVDPDKIFRIKRSPFNLRSFLADDKLAERFAFGSMVVGRLCLSDYHHFHFPDSGVPQRAVSIKGKYYAVGPYALDWLIPFYTENHRMLTLFDSDHFGQMAIVEIGAFTVGSIQQRYSPGMSVSRGAEKGGFELGGSTVVLLFQKGKIELDQDLCINTEKEIETYLHLGESVGRKPNWFTKTGRMRR